MLLQSVPPYDAEYYAHGCGPIPYERSPHWLNFFSGIAAELVRSLRPKRVFDAGCAWGFLVEAFWDLGVEAHGVDISAYAIGNVRRDMQPFCRVGSLTEPIRGVYDLLTCIEVLEHMPAEEAQEAVRHMTAAADTILFSSTPNDFNEPTHVNVRPTIYWLKLFAEHNFAPDVLYDASFISPHAFLVRRQLEPPPEDVLILFGETLRNRIYKTAFVTRQTRLEELEREREDLTGQITKLSQHVGELSHKYTELKSKPAELAAMQQQVAALQDLSETWKQKALQWESSAAKSATVIGQLTLTVAKLQGTLQEIHSSPGWQFIARYREWLRRNAEFRKRFDPAILWALKSMRLSASLPAVPPPVVVTPAALLPASPPVKAADWYDSWIRESEPSETQLVFQRQFSLHFGYQPLISVVVPVYKVPDEVLREAIESVQEQTYPHWELCVAHAAVENAPQREYLSSLAKKDSRIKVKLLAANDGISGNSNQALDLATGEFAALLDHDDTLAPFALFEVVQLLNEDPSANFIYSDKDQLTASGQRVSPLFKSQWSPHTMLNANYLTHLCVMRTAQIREIGGWRKETDGAQDWDLFLRIIAQYGKVRHIPKVLYHWRQIATSVASGGIEAKPYAAQGQVRAVEDYCRESGLDVRVEFVNGIGLRIFWPPQTGIQASVFCIGHSRAQVEELQAKTSYAEVEIVATSVDRLVEAVKDSTGQLLVFIDASVTPADPSWLTELTGPLRDPTVGLCGAKLVDPSTHLLRHCGIVFNRDGSPQYIYAGQPEHVCEEFGAAGWYRDWSAVSGACFAIRRQVWKQFEGLAPNSIYGRLDIDLCLRIGLRSDLRIVYNPFARLYQSGTAALEQPTGRNPEQAQQFMRACFPSGDPYFSPHLNCQQGKLVLVPPLRPAAQTPTDYAADSRALVGIYDVAEDQVEQSKNVCARAATGRMERVTWFLPEFTHAFYGGLHTILRFADHLSRIHNVQASICVIGNGESGRYRRSIAEAFPDLDASMELRVIRNYADAAHLPASDAAVATLWTTAWAALRFQNTRQKFYFIQDDEALFYPAGSTSALVEASYRFGFKGICNTVSILDSYRARGGEGEYFAPAIDTAVFHSNGRHPIGPKPYTLFCYARPGHPRNCFEMLSAALRILKERFGDDLRILSAGARLDVRAYGLEGMVENMGLLGYRATGALYRMCDAGLVMMMTRHPSYLPLELMGCGSLVVTNRNPDTAWLLEDNVNCLLAEPSPTSLADRVEEGLRDVALRRRITEHAAALIRNSHSNWDQQIEKIYRYMLSQC